MVKRCLQCPSKESTQQASLYLITRLVSIDAMTPPKGRPCAESRFSNSFFSSLTFLGQLSEMEQEKNFPSRSPQFCEENCDNGFSLGNVFLWLLHAFPISAQAPLLLLLLLPSPEFYRFFCELFTRSQSAISAS